MMRVSTFFLTPSTPGECPESVVLSRAHGRDERLHELRADHLADGSAETEAKR
jgi:hypothetical protein